MENTENEKKIIELFERNDFVTGKYIKTNLSFDKGTQIKSVIHKLQRKGYAIVEIRNGRFSMLKESGDMKNQIRKYSKEKQLIDEKIKGLMIAYSLKVGIKCDPFVDKKTFIIATKENHGKQIECELDEKGEPILPESDTTGD